MRLLSIGAALIGARGLRRAPLLSDEDAAAAEGAAVLRLMYLTRDHALAYARLDQEFQRRVSRSSSQTWRGS